MTAPFAPMTKKDVAAVLMCTTRHIEIMVKSGEIPPPRLLAGHVFWHPDVFYSWLDSELRGSSSSPNCVVTPVPGGEPQRPKVRNGTKANAESNSPASRMKAAQAARMALQV